MSGYGRYSNGVLVSNGTGTSFSFTGLACGTSYTLAVDAFDAAGNRSAKASVVATTSACSDTAAPSVPSGLSASAPTQTSLSASWVASTDNVGVTGYGRYSNGVLVSNGTGTSFSFTGLACGTSYTLAVDAFDASGNRSAKASVVATTSACIDTTPPTTPGNLVATSATQSSVALSWAASLDNVGVTGYSVYRNGAEVGNTTLTSYTVSGLVCGTSYVLAVDAYDAAGNRPAKAQITTSTSPCPDTQAPSVPAGLVVSGQTQTGLILAWNASTDNVGVTGYATYRDGSSVGTTVPATRTYTFSGLSCGTVYVLGVDAVDAAGNRSARGTANGTTSACSPPPVGSGNIWVDVNGGTCADNASPVAYNDAAACTWAQANSTSEGGDTVMVKGGSYGNVTLRGSNGRSSAVTFRTVPGETVTAGDLDLGIWQSCGYGAASTTTTNWFTLVGPIRTSQFHADCSNRVVIDGLDMNGGGAAVTQPFNAQSGATNFTLRNSKIHNAKNASAMMVLEGSNFVIDNNDIYDLINDTGGAIHDECLRAQPVNNMTMTRNHFWSCNVMDVFITGSGTATNWLVENNIFEAPTGSAGNAENGCAFRGGGEPSPNPDGFILRYNTFADTGVQINGSDNPVTANGFTVYGNYFETNPPCGLSNSTYSYNVSPTGSSNCGGTGAKSFAASAINAGFVNYHPYDGNGGPTAEPAGDYHLLSSSPLRDTGNMAAYPAVDRDGNSRYTGSGPDAGGHEGP